MSKQYSLVCRPKKWISEPDLKKHYSNDLDLHVYENDGQVVSNFELMCGAIDDAIHARYLESVLDDAGEVEAGRVEWVEEETEGWLFWIRSNEVTFEGKFDQGSGGKVSLEQFKLAVSTFRDFLNDPKRDPIEVPFPDGDGRQQVN
ncbi:MAG: hypothetical protein V4757_11175 [Pseudomonadota bacterium]